MEKNEIIFSFYLIPFFLSVSIRIFFEGKFFHFATGLVFNGLQAKLISIIIIIFIIYILYRLFFKIPKKFNKNYKIKYVTLKFIKSKFFYSLLLLLLFQVYLRIFILNNIIYFIIFILLLVLNYIYQKEFLNSCIDYLNLQ